ncbi:hypothetical protein Tco_1522002, partial [Tanacetum coccineum]
MANENVPAPAPTRSDDQILPFAAWVPIGKSNFVLDLQKKQRNPIFQISFLNTLQYEAKTRAYSFQLDESRFILDANLLRESLEITPIDQAHQFVSPPLGDAIMDFVNELGYTEELHFVSRMTMLWGIITSTNVDYVELMWEEFVQAIQAFLADKANLGIATQKGKKTKPHVIPYFRFTKLIICYLGRTHNIHQRSESPFHLAEEDHRLGNLKHDQKIAAEQGGKKKSASKVVQSTKPATAKQPKPVSSKQSKPAPATQAKPVKEKPTPVKKHAKVDEDKLNLQRGIQMSLEEFDAQEVQGKGKGIATDKQVAQSLLELQMPKKT